MFGPWPSSKLMYCGCQVLSMPLGFCVPRQAVSCFDMSGAVVPPEGSR